MKMASRLIDLSSKKNKLYVQHTFSSNQQKANLHEQHAFLSFSCLCFARLQRCFERLKRQTSQLHTIFMEKLSYVLTQYFVSSVHVRFYFSLPAHFHLAGRQHFSFSHRRFEFPCFSSYEFSITRSCSFSVIHVSVHKK